MTIAAHNSGNDQKAVALEGQKQRQATGKPVRGGKRKKACSEPPWEGRATQTSTERGQQTQLISPSSKKGIPCNSSKRRTLYFKTEKWQVNEQFKAFSQW